MSELASEPSAPGVQASQGIETSSGHEPDERGHFGRYGGRWVPEALVAALDELETAYEKARHDPEFLAELDRLHRDYTGRPSPLTAVSSYPPAAGTRALALGHRYLYLHFGARSAGIGTYAW